MHHRAFAIQVESEGFHLEHVKGNVRKTLQLNAQDSCLGCAERRYETIGSQPLSLRYPQGPQCRLVARPELARNSFDWPAIEHGSFWNPQTAGQLSVLWVGLKFRNGHRRYGTQIVRVENIEQSLSNLRKIVVYAKVNAGGQQRKGLEYPLNVGILTTIRFQHKP